MELTAGSVSLPQALLIFCSATLAGAASGVPGGLGVMEASLVWQLQAAGVAPVAALAATLALRASTLWTAMLTSGGLAGVARQGTSYAAAGIHHADFKFVGAVGLNGNAASIC